MFRPSLNTLSQIFGGSSFELSELQSETVVRQILIGGSVPGFGQTYAGKEALLDQRLGQTAQNQVVLAHDTREYAAVMSVFYNGPGNVPPNSKLAAALQSGNRAEAWFEIRYDTNSNPVTTANGIAKRRYYESTIFSLYDDRNATAQSIGEAEAKQVYQTFTLHRDRILAYEAAYGSQIESANTSYVLNGTPDVVRTLDANLAAAGGWLLQTYVGDAGFSNIDPIDLKDIQVGKDFSIQVLRGTDSPDLILGEGGDDEIMGRGGKDILYGGTENDLLDGGTGDDILIGGAGEDTYVFSSGDGNDTVIDSDGNAALIRDGQKIALGVAAVPNSGTWTWVGGSGNLTTFTKVSGNDSTDLEIKFTDTPSDKITVKNFDFAAAAQGGYLGIRLVDAGLALQNPARAFTGDTQDFDSDPGQAGIQPADDGFGNTVRTVEVVAGRADTFKGSSANEVERFDTAGGNDVVDADGSSSATSTAGGRDFVLAGAGNDVVRAGGNDDWVEGGDGSDILSGNAGADVLFGATAGGASTLDAGNLATLIVAGDTAPDPNAPAAARDWLAGGDGDDWLVGSSADDALMGGLGADVLLGGAGNDYLYSDADLTALGTDWSASVDAQGNRIFTDSVGTSYLNSTQGGADLIYAGAGNDEVVAGAGDDAVYGESGDDVIFAGLGSDMVLGGAGNDFIFGESLAESALAATNPDLATNDYLDGGDGDDTIFGMAGSDVIYGGAGNDTLNGDEATLAASVQGNDYLDGGAGDDFLAGQGGNDTLAGGTGTDMLQGGTGKDTYIFNRGDGVDTVDDSSVTADEASVIVLGDGIERADVKFRLGSLAIDTGGGDVLHIEGFNSQDPLSTPVIDSIRFADGSMMTYQDVLAQGFDIDGTADNDVVLYGTAVTDRIDAKGGNDWVSALSGDDTITGGTGNDVLYGGAGADTYVFNLGDGDDIVSDTAEANVVRFGPGISAADLSVLHYTGLNPLNQFAPFMQVSYGAGGDRIRIENGLLGHVVRYEFADGTTLSHAELMQRSVAPVTVYGTQADENLAGSNFDDYISADAGNDTVLGQGGADIIYGGDGNDTLAGGTGNDTLYGGAGDDAYTLSAGDGTDVVHDDEGANRIVFGDGIAASDLSLNQFVGDDGLDYLTVTYPGGSVEIASGVLGRVGTFAFADGSTSTLGELLQGAPALVVRGTDQAETLFGSNQNDELFGAGGDDVIDGQGGHDLQGNWFDPGSAIGAVVSPPKGGSTFGEYRPRSVPARI